MFIVDLNHQMKMKGKEIMEELKVKKNRIVIKKRLVHVIVIFQSEKTP